MWSISLNPSFLIGTFGFLNLNNDFFLACENSVGEGSQED